MTRINLLPPERVKEKRRVAPARSYVWLLIVLPLIAIVIVVFWFMSMNGKISEKTKLRDEANQELSEWQAKVSSYKKYEEMETGIKTKTTNALGALKGRVYWARILNEVAIMCPTDIWLTSLTGTSQQGQSGTVQFAGYALQCSSRIVPGRSYPYLPDYRPIASWLERMAQIAEFQKIWLSNAAPTQVGVNPAVVATTTETTTTQTTGYWVISFGSTATLNMNTAIVGPQSSSPSSPAPATPPTGGGAE
ncbi:MAG: hypothetical protein PHP64_00980 [Actinomycetota bacterium]|nr:hypothetical protein [Actinomycetota bacterium]